MSVTVLTLVILGVMLVGGLIAEWLVDLHMKRQRRREIEHLERMWR